jgi:hypothetical protein
MKHSYQKPDAVKELQYMAMDEARKKYPNHPSGVLAPRIYRDDTANSLTNCIVKYITLKSGFASRVNNTGIYNQKLRKYVPGTSKKGLPDIIGTYKGKSLFIEVKIGRDVQSEAQKRIQEDHEASGGLYFLAHTFTEFKKWFDSI